MAADETPAPETAVETAAETAAAPPPSAPAPTGLKAKANDMAMKAYLKAPPKAQTAILNGVVKAQPVVNRAKRYAKPAAAAAGLLVLRRLRRRKG